MSHQDLVDLICERVVEELKTHETCMGLDHKNFWDDYQDHVVNGWSFVSSMLMKYVESLIAIEIEKLPEPVQIALWWQTDKGKDAMFDAKWCYKHGEPFEPYLGIPAEDDKMQVLSDLVLQALSTKAEREALEREALELAEPSSEDGEQDDSEETDK